MSISPGLLYHDAATAIDWLCRVFGCERRLVVQGSSGHVLHATLTLGRGMLMLSSAEHNAFPQVIRAPREVGGVGTVEIIVHVAAVDEHYAHAVREGADIVMAIEDKPYGGRGYTARDPEGHVWHFGSYDPWAAEAVGELRHD